MNIEVGETYNVRVKVTNKDEETFSAIPENTMVGLGFMWFHCDAFSPLTTPPKHDPCRRFKKGDKVRVVEYKGRSYSLYWKKRLGEILTVTESEDETADTEVDEQGIDPAYLELVTPVEELEPYHLNELSIVNIVNLVVYEVARADTRDTIFYGGEAHLRTIEQAKEAAEAECARLNAEWRKEQENV